MAERMNVGVVGVGDMGMPILGSYVRGGHDVWAFDLRTSALDEAERRGAKRADSLAALASRADLVAVVVVDDHQLQSVLDAEDGIFANMRQGATIAVHTTSIPETVIDLARRATDLGLGFLDCPVTGGTVRAEKGDLVVLVGGPEGQVGALRSVLSSLGTVEHVGEVGAGQAMKLANNLMHFGNKAFVYQALKFTAAYGITEDAVRRVCAEGTGDSWTLRNLDHLDTLLLSHTLAGTDELFEFLSKDIWMAAIAARHRRVHLPLVAAAAEMLPALERDRQTQLHSRLPG